MNHEEAELKRMKKELEDYKTSFTDLMEAKNREIDNLKTEIKGLMAETDLIPVQYEALRKKRNRQIREIQKKFHEEMNEAMKKKEKKIEEIIADLEKDLGGEEKDEGRGVWQMVFHPIQYFWGLRKQEIQKPTIKRIMEVDADEDEPVNNNIKTTKLFFNILIFKRPREGRPVEEREQDSRV
ncbi:hypothetical protein B9Z55_023695 [Caenorhabditis nigoni]|uniref:Uncharacterized protein n=1 Tax=Caenorhabditis nigoni TaxID=1611254 RepID=A0A2G5SRH9_9PELO|nr:hypothetical protein B9Z55_023695 [Caenorhabditis nigoni]